MRRKGSTATAVARAVFDTLELRRLLAGVVINEFLADNQSGIVDQDSTHSDWIELRNTDATSVNVAGWSLTDDSLSLGKWHFPSVSIPAGGYLLVFASGKDRAVAGQELHTNFSLDNDGEYLALVKPDGTTIADSYNPYPAQDPDISYGKGASSVITDTLVNVDVPVKVKVPTGASSIDSTWRNLNFTPDGTWLSGITGVGYDTNPSPVDYTPYIGLNIGSQLAAANNTTAYIRMNFDVADPSVLTSLHLKMRYDDGFIVYLNGTEIPSARRNATGITPAWNSATAGNATHSDDSAILYEDIDISSSRNLLVAGNNVLAVHALNATTAPATC
jgi:hypothetical protein